MVTVTRETDHRETITDLMVTETRETDHREIMTDRQEMAEDLMINSRVESLNLTKKITAADHRETMTDLQEEMIEIPAHLTELML